VKPYGEGKSYFDLNKSGKGIEVTVQERRRRQSDRIVQPLL